MTAAPNPQQRPAVRAPAPQTKQPEPPKSDRTFSKCLTVSVIAAYTVMAAYGLHSGNPQTSEILGTYGMWAMGGLYPAIRQNKAFPAPHGEGPASAMHRTIPSTIPTA